MMKVKKILVLVIFTVLISGCGGSEETDENSNKAEENIKNVVVDTPFMGSISNRVQFNGEVKPETDFWVSAKIAEKIKSIKVENGSYVNKGEVLFELHSLTQEKSYESAKARYQSAKSQYDLRKKDLERNKILFEKRVINETTFDNIQNAYEAAANSKTEAYSAYVIAGDNLENTKITAPVDGFFVDKKGETGQMINPGFVFGRVIVADTVFVETFVSREQICELEIGTKAEIENKFGEIISANMAADRVSRNFKVKIKIDNETGCLKPNSFVSGEFLTQIRENVPLILKDSVLFDEEGYFIFTVENKRAVKKRITIEASSNGEIFSPEIKRDCKVVVSGQSVIEDGDKIRIVEE
ncbi:MAG: efflux RND transporter periplasmic adaptor subunit [Candidatus Muiribacteriota bacterium]